MTKLLNMRENCEKWSGRRAFHVISLLSSVLCSTGELRQLNPPRLKFWLKSQSNNLLIDFFYPNLSSQSESSQWNQLKQVQYQFNCSKSFVFTWKHFNLIKNRSKLFKNYQKIWLILTFLIDFIIFDLLIDIFNFLFGLLIDFLFENF